MKNTDGSGAERRMYAGNGRFAVLLITLAVFLAANLSIRFLQDRAQSDQSTVTALTRLLGLAHELDALQWRAVAERRMPLDGVNVQRGVAEQARFEMARLEEHNHSSEQIRRATAAYRRYEALSDRQLALMIASRHEDARALEATGLASAFAELHESTRVASAEFRASAWRSKRLADIGTSVLLFVAALSLAYLTARVARARYRAMAVKTHEAALRESEKRFRGLFEHSVIGLFQITPDGHISLANPSLVRMLGYATEGELRGRSMREGFHMDPDTWRRAEALLDADGEMHGRECLWQRADGSAIFIRLNIKAIHGADGSLACYEGSVEDITERRKAEDALVASEQRLSRILENNANGIVLVDLEGRLVFANAAAEQILGMPRSMLSDLTYFDPGWMPESAAGGALPNGNLPVAQVIASREAVFDVEMTFRHPSGRRVILSCNAAPLEDADGAVAGVVVSFSDVTERKSLEERLTHQALHDPLTGLPNRTLFMDRLEKALARAQRSGKPLGVLFLDLDNFKYVNDSLGHAMGDRLLVAVTQRLQRLLRAGDTVARFGGDEFVFVVDEVQGPDDVLEIANRLLEEVQRPFALGTRELVISPSIGIAMGGLNMQTPSELLRNADAAMYTAKTRGKGRVMHFDSSMNDHAVNRLELESALRNALDRGEMIVHYQPTVVLSCGQVASAEALVRWQHPERGLMQPGEFIPLAEETGLIVPIGRWVLREACRACVAWNALRPTAPPISVGVNLSAKQFQDPRLVTDVAEALRDAGLPAARLTLEITESVVMDEVESTVSKLQDLHALGVQLAIDDFGTGYSSLSYLKRFPVDYLKIDRSFVKGLGRETEDTVIVSATISLAHALGLRVVAEGAERMDQITELVRLGCDAAQGYGMARPLAPEDLNEFLQRNAGNGLSLNGC